MEKFFDAYYSAVRQYFVKNVSNREDAKDLTQEVWLKFLVFRKQPKQIDNLKAWIFTVARNTLIDYYRKNNHKKSVSEWDNTFKPIPETNNADLQEKLSTCLTYYIQDLQNDVKKILIASDIKGVSQKILAQQLNMSYPTLRSKLQRGRKKIRQMFERDCYLELGTRGEVLDCQCKC